MRLRIFIDEGKNKAKQTRKSKSKKNDKTSKPTTSAQSDKDKARRKYWAIRKAKERKNAGANNEQEKAT